MSTAQTDFTTFYSWQSDLPDETNRQAIRSALRTASNKVEVAAPQFRVVLDEATRGEPGSPNIPATILEKIRSSDVFICDITTINSTADAALRRTPNPNVLFELGYAVAHLGWNRIIMLFNDEFGDVSTSPFDIDRHRISRYKISVAEAKNKGSHGNLVSVLTDGLLSVSQNNPKRPLESADLNPEEIRRKRDIANLKWVLAAIHFPTLDKMILELPDILNSRALHFWEGFNSIVEDSLFHLYDRDSLTVVRSIHKAWKTCVSNGEQYHMATNPNIYVFRNLCDAPFTMEQDRIWKTIDFARATLRESQNKLLKIVRDRYLEIDIDDMNAAAWREYVEFQRDNERQFEREET